jgi:23S rRNA (guanine745-N1)-methyltransferase
MSICAFAALACPLCHLPLTRVTGSWHCASGHSFDSAREGHVHLLPVQHKRSRDPGDSKDMVAARRRFLSAGHYQPLADAVCTRLLQDAEPGMDTPLSVLDAGCGEGFYLRALAAGTPRPLALLGLDISKWAVLAAAKQQRETAWVVASNANLPVQSGTLDWLLCLFGFPVYAQFHRVLKPGGLLLQVDPGPGHLQQLRELIYPQLKPERDTPSILPAGFALRRDERLRFDLSLVTPQDIADLLLMTPHLFRASAQGKARVAALQQLDLSVDVRLQTLQKIC